MEINDFNNKALSPVNFISQEKRKDITQLLRSDE